MKYLLIFVMIFISIFFIDDVVAEGMWTTYTNGNDINDITVQDNYIWCATWGGVVRWNMRDFTYKKYYSQDGLCENLVNSIALSPDGNIWCGSVEGLSCFDGTKWTRYKKYLHYFPKIAVAPNGNVWCAKKAYGVDMFDGTTWKNYTTDDGLVNNVLSSITVGPQGNVWCTGEGGVSHFDGNTWITYTTDDGLPCKYVNSVAISPNGDVWCGSQKGLSHFDGEKWTNYNPTDPPSFFVYMSPVVLGPDGSIWCGAYSRIYRFDGKTWTNYKTKYGWSLSWVSSIIPMPDGDLWLGTSNGLSHFNGETITTYTTEDNLLSHSIVALAIGQDCEIWCGTGNGLYRIHEETWTRYTPDDGYGGYYVNTIAVGQDGRIWCGRNKGVSNFDGNNWSTFYFSPVDSTVSSDYDVQTLAIGPDGNVWVGTSRKGVFCFNGEIWNNYTIEDGLAHNSVLSIAFGPDDEILFGTNGGGISIFDGKTWKNYTAENSGLERNYIYGIATEPNGTIWCGTDCVLQRFDGEKWTSFYDLNGRVKISISPDGDIWFLTSCYGVTRFDGETWITYTTDNGLADNRAQSIAFAPDGSVWIGTLRGLSRFETDSQTFAEGYNLIPSEITITGNNPNPFNPLTTIEFTIPHEAIVNLTIYNMMGQKVRSLKSDTMKAGSHTIRWDGKDNQGHDVSSGVYLAVLKTGAKIATHKMLLLR